MRIVCRLALGILCALWLTGGSVAHAGEVADFDQALGDAWAQCRDALYQSDRAHRNAAAAGEALGAFRSAWRRLTERWSTHPPPQYSEDSDFARELAAIGEITEQAARAAQVGQIAQAHALLDQVPALLADMRRKNGLEAYTDHLDSFAEQLAEITDDALDKPELSPAQVVTLVRQIAVLGYLGERLEKRAPAGRTEDGEFLRQIEEINAQLRGLSAAVLAGQRAPVLAAVSDIRRAFDRFYLLYG